MATSRDRVSHRPSAQALAGAALVAVAVVVIAGWFASIEAALFTAVLVLLLGRLAWLVARRPGSG